MSDRPALEKVEVSSREMIESADRQRVLSFFQRFYDETIDKGERVVFDALKGKISREELLRHAGSYIELVDILTQIHKDCDPDRQPPKPYYFFPVGPHPIPKRVCLNCGIEYDPSTSKCCPNPLIPKTGQWVGPSVCQNCGTEFDYSSVMSVMV